MSDPQRVAIIVQARLTSWRLPRKVFADIGDHPMLWHVLRRAAQLSGRLIVAIPSGNENAELNEWCLGHPISQCVIEGPEWDVLARYRLAARIFDAEWIVRVSSDCPLLAPDLSQRVIDETVKNRWDYGSNVPGVDGLDTEVFSRRVLEMAYQETEPQHRESVTMWMRSSRCPYILRGHVAGPPCTLKLSVDTSEDLARVRQIIAKLPANPTGYWRETAVAIEAAGLEREGPLVIEPDDGSR